ncbi:MAG: sulfur carrier protein ThiS [Janthinobacterium lividum]
MLNIQLNRDRMQAPDGATLASLIAALPEVPTSLATAVNSEFVPRGMRTTYALKEGDVVTTFMPITGG